MNRWNGIYGEVFGTAVLPISWGEHAAAEFGEAPQDVLNKQLVDKCDGCIAVFANRLGTPTATADSGTAEEIQRLADSGKYVAVLRCERPANMRHVDLDQAKSLNEYLRKIKSNSLVFAYSTEADLMRHVDSILTNAVSRDRARAEVQLQAPIVVASAKLAEVWPRVDARERLTRSGSSRDWWLVLHNTGNGPARDVRFRTETPLHGDNWDILRESSGDEPDIPMLAPNGEMAFPIGASMGSAVQVNCIVTWIDDRGPQENRATLRLN
jgi:hypothetical protein